MENTFERRKAKRIEKRRDVVIAHENSDNFYNAELIDHSPDGVCFQSTHLFQTGTRIYLMTKNKPIDDLNDRFTEAYFADIIWCRELEGQYRVGASIARSELVDYSIYNRISNVEEH